jgi:hypothetical protein
MLPHSSSAISLKPIHQNGEENNAFVFTGFNKPQSVSRVEYLNTMNKTAQSTAHNIKGSHVMSTSKHAKMRNTGMLPPTLNQVKSKKQETLDKDIDVYKRYAPVHKPTQNSNRKIQ